MRDILNEGGIKPMFRKRSAVAEIAVSQETAAQVSKTDDKPVLAVTLGDPAGIGPELVAKALADGLFDRAKTVIVGDRGILERGMKDTGIKASIPVAQTIGEALETPGTVLLQAGSLDASQVKLGETSPEYGKDQGDLLVQCIRWCEQGYLDGFCFAPLNKAALKAGGYNFPSEHEMFARYYGLSNGYGEMNVLDGLWNIRVTSHIPLSDVAKNITAEKVLETVRLGYRTLKRSGIERPKMAMAALNPHAGEHGTCGREEIDILGPAIEEAKAQGFDIEGPFASDTLFIRAFREKKWNGVVTMYHDQGQIAIKLRGFEHCVTVSAGLPNAVTTPAHGTAYDIAGTGSCKISAFCDAFNVCANLASTDRIARESKK